MRRASQWLALFLLAIAPPSWAQSPIQRPGLVIGVGFGTGSFRGTCSACGDGTLGLDREVTIAVALHPRVQIGASVVGWIGASEGYAEHEAAILATLRAYPVAVRPIHIDLGAGMGRYRVGFDPGNGDTQRISADALAWSVGVGYDIRFARRVVVVPQIAYRQMASAMMDLDGVDLTESGFRVLSIGVALRWAVAPFGPQPEGP